MGPSSKGRGGMAGVNGMPTVKREKETQVTQNQNPGPEWKVARLSVAVLEMPMEGFLNLMRKTNRKIYAVAFGL